MASIQYVVSAQDAASATFERIAGSADNVLHKLDEIGHKSATARVGVAGDKEAELTIDKLDLKMAKWAQRVATGKMSLEGQARVMLQLRAAEAELDAFGRKDVTAKVRLDTSQLSKLSAFQPSALGTAAALSPALIPLAGSIAGAVGAITLSFGAATFAAAGFGLMAKTVLTGAQSDLQKLQALNVRLANASTAAQKQAIEQQIAQLKSGWAKGYLDLINNYQTFQMKWKSVSQAITVPALNAWIPALTKGLQLLKPLLQPVADLFKSWGQSLDKYFSNPVTILHLKDIAATLGNFAAIQIGQIAKFVTDLAKGFYNLGKDLPPGTQLGAAGTALAGIGDAFLKWSKSKQARDDVHAFFKFLHDEGPVVRSILSDLGMILPGLFAGMTVAGKLELQLISDFLHWLTSLPKDWQKPITEFAGAMLLLSKVGVVKVGLQLVGLGGAIPGLAAAGSAGGPLAAGGAAIAAGLVLKIREDLKAGIVGIGKDLPGWFSGIGGIVGVSAQGWADAIVNRFQKPVLAAEKAFGRAFLGSIQSDWNAVTASFHAFTGTMVASFHAFTGALLASMRAFGGALLGSARAAWNAVTASARAFATDVVAVFKGITGRALAAMFGLGHALAAFARAAFNEMLNAIKNVAGSIWSWLTSWVNRLPGFLKKLLGIKSPSSVFYDIGKQMMLGLFHGIQDHARHARTAAQGAVGGAAGVAGPGGGAPAANAALARRMMPAWASGANWAAWNYVAMRESGWNQFARNPSSGAYGIPQALPASKMGPAANPPQSNPAAQISWMIGYINQRYQGSPVIAAQHEANFNWYDRGGWLPVGASLSYNATGQPEQVVGPASMAQVVALLAQILRAVQIAPSATSAGTARALNSAARAALR